MLRLGLRDSEIDYEQEHDESHCPIRNFEKWKDLRCDLNQQPADDPIGDSDLVNIAPPQFVEEALHGPMHSKSFAAFGRQKFLQPAKRQYSGSFVTLSRSRKLYLLNRESCGDRQSCVVIIAKTETARPGRVPGPEGMTLPMLSDRPDPLSPCKSLKTIIEIRPYRSLLSNGFCYGIFSARKDTFVLHQHGFFIGITSKN